MFNFIFFTIMHITQHIFNFWFFCCAHLSISEKISNIWQYSAIRDNQQNSIFNTYFVVFQAAILLATAVLDKTDFIKESMNGNDQKTDLDVPNLASAVMRHIAQLVSNAHAITQLMPSDNGESVFILITTRSTLLSFFQNLYINLFCHHHHHHHTILFIYQKVMAQTHGMKNSS